MPTLFANKCKWYMQGERERERERERECVCSESPQDGQILTDQAKCVYLVCAGIVGGNVLDGTIIVAVARSRGNGCGARARRHRCKLAGTVSYEAHGVVKLDAAPRSRSRPYGRRPMAASAACGHHERAPGKVATVAAITAATSRGWGISAAAVSRRRSIAATAAAAAPTTVSGRWGVPATALSTAPASVATVSRGWSVSTTAGRGCGRRVGNDLARSGDAARWHRHNCVSIGSEVGCNSYPFDVAFRGQDNDRPGSASNSVSPRGPQYTTRAQHIRR